MPANCSGLSSAYRPPELSPTTRDHLSHGISAHETNANSDGKYNRYVHDVAEVSIMPSVPVPVMRCGFF
jgi:hypothetical protein